MKIQRGRLARVEDNAQAGAGCVLDALGWIGLVGLLVLTLATWGAGDGPSLFLALLVLGLIVCWWKLH